MFKKIVIVLLVLAVLLLALVAAGWLLPDRWVVSGWIDGTDGDPDFVTTGNPIREPLALGPDPHEAGADHDEEPNT